MPTQPLCNTDAPPSNSTLASIKIQNRAKQEEEKLQIKKKKAVITMIELFFQEMGYIRSLEALQQDSNIRIGRNVFPADNMDLLTIFTTFEDFYQIRFNKRPKFFKTEKEQMTSSTFQCNSGGEATLDRRKPVVKVGNDLEFRIDPLAQSRGEDQSAASATPREPLSADVTTANGMAGNPRVNTVIKMRKRVSACVPDANLGLEGRALCVGSKNKSSDALDEYDSAGSCSDSNGSRDDYNLFRGMKPLPAFPTAELTDLAMTIQRDILETNPNTKFEDIVGHEHAKQLLREAVVMPVKYPQLFAGIMRPWKGILLFGPPGTGKSMLARAVASCTRTVFFNISASTIVSKWRGDSEKLVRILFDLAYHYAPSTIFIDELDSLLSSRGGGGGMAEHESSRRMKTELLVQMDGLCKRKGGDVVFVLAATNVPWDLDGAVLRRLEKRVLVPLPGELERRWMLVKKLRKASPPSNSKLESRKQSVEKRASEGNNKAKCDQRGPADVTGLAINEEQLERCVELTEGYSGADIDILCREAAMRPLRKLIQELELKGRGAVDCRSQNSDLVRPPISFADLEASIQCTRSSSKKEDVKKYMEWEQKYGSGIS